MKKLKVERVLFISASEMYYTRGNFTWNQQDAHPIQGRTLDICRGPLRTGLSVCSELLLAHSYASGGNLWW